MAATLARRLTGGQAMAINMSALLIYDDIDGEGIGSWPEYLTPTLMVRAAYISALATTIAYPHP
jgi:hypothetical protein